MIIAQVYGAPKSAFSLRIPDTFHLLVDLEYICVGYRFSEPNSHLKRLFEPQYVLECTL